MSARTARPGVLLAVTGEPGEAAVVTRLVAADSPVEVLRRCLDLVDLLAGAATLVVAGCVVAGSLPRLDRSAVERLHEAGLVVVGLAADEPAERRLAMLGCDAVLPVSATAAAVGAAVRAGQRPAGELLARAEPGGPATGGADGGVGTGGAGGSSAHDIGAQSNRDVVGSGPFAHSRPGASEQSPATGRPTSDLTGASSSAPRGLGDFGDGGDLTEFTDLAPSWLREEPGTLVAVWGPRGAPGRTTIALGLADALARASNATVVLVDADVAGPGVAVALGLLEAAPGLPTAAHRVERGALDVPGVADLLTELRPGLLVLPAGVRGFTPSPLATRAVLDLLRRLAAVVVVDLGPDLAGRDGLPPDPWDTGSAAVTSGILAEADVVVVVGAATPLGLLRLRDAVAELAQNGPVDHVVVTGVRCATAPDVRSALEDLAGTVTLVPADPAIAAAWLAGQTIVEHAPRSRAAQAIAELAGQLVQAGVPA